MSPPPCNQHARPSMRARLPFVVQGRAPPAADDSKQERWPAARSARPARRRAIVNARAGPKGVEGAWQRRLPVAETALAIATERPAAERREQGTRGAGGVVSPSVRVFCRRPAPPSHQTNTHPQPARLHRRCRMAQARPAPRWRPPLPPLLRAPLFADDPRPRGQTVTRHHRDLSPLRLSPPNASSRTELIRQRLPAADLPARARLGSRRPRSLIHQAVDPPAQTCAYRRGAQVKPWTSTRRPGRHLGCRCSGADDVWSGAAHVPPLTVPDEAVFPPSWRLTAIPAPLTDDRIGGDNGRLTGMSC